MKIQAVNGQPLEPPFVVAFFRAGKEIQAPRSGDAFDYYVHEWGSFDGHVTAPKELEIDPPSVAHDGFHYRPQDAIHESNSAERHPGQQRR